MKKSEFEAKLLLLEKESNAFNPREHNDKTKSKIALFFVQWYFYIIIGTILAVLIYNPAIRFFTGNTDSFINIKDTLLIVTSAVGSPLGFIIGHYFKENGK